MSVSHSQTTPITRELLLGYFLGGATPRADWRIGMELEKLGRTADGRPLPYDGARASIRSVLELVRERRGGDPVFEGNHLIGIDAPWGTISLEPGGQVEWSSRPHLRLSDLGRDLDEHVATMNTVATELDLRWLDVAVDPELSVGEMIWMPKARYAIMRRSLARRGRLAHRMMTQTASIQCAYDYADPDDWKRKFRAAALLTPVATALFANSARIDGGPSGYRSYRQMIWRETDPDRCGLPSAVFEDNFDLERWLDWVLEVPTLFLHRADGLVASGGEPFSRLMERNAGAAATSADWETHVSTIFTDVRSYTYIEVRSADLLPDALALAVPTFWTGILYGETLDEALDLTRELASAEAWREAVEIAARDGLDGRLGGRSLREISAAAVSMAARGLRGGAACAGDPCGCTGPLEKLAEARELDLRP
jgi:glutamate--cysteine ligase